MNVTKAENSRLNERYTSVYCTSTTIVLVLHR